METPDDPDVQGAFRRQLRKLLREDALFANQIEQLVKETQNPSLRMEDTTIVIANKFSAAEREIERLQSKIRLQRGAWIFKQHIYSVRDLLESEHCNKIYAICEKIGDDVLHWYQNSAISEDGKDTYRKGRERIQRKLRAVNKEIEERAPTVWESFMSIFEDFVVLVSKTMPTVGKLIKLVAGILDVDLPELLTAAHKLLTSPQSKSN